jgi:RNA-directed DNA polymerase
MDSANLLTKRHWIVELARRKPGGVLYSLNHVIDFEWMREAYLQTRKDGATGIDGVTAADYEANLEANLRDLRERIMSGRYHAPPVRRTYIPTADGSRGPHRASAMGCPPAAARHSDLRRQDSATRDHHGAGGGV